MNLAELPTDVHVHIQPWEMMHPAALETIRKGREDYALIEELMKSPRALPDHLDSLGIGRVGVIKPNRRRETADGESGVGQFPQTVNRKTQVGILADTRVIKGFAAMGFAQGCNINSRRNFTYTGIAHAY